MTSANQTASEERFGVGVSIRSKRLSVADITDVIALFGELWNGVRAKELRPQQRSGLDGELGASLHTHLRDSSPDSATKNILIATTLLALKPVEILRSRDPQAVLDIHIEQHLPDHGAIQPVYLSADAVHALGAEMGQRDVGLDIDQYGADGYSVINALLNPFLSKRELLAEKLRFALELTGAPAQTGRFEIAVPDPYDLASPIAQMGKHISEFVSQEELGSTALHGHCVLEQVLPIYNSVGPSLWLDPTLLLLLDENNCDLTIRTRIGPELILRRHNNNSPRS